MIWSPEFIEKAKPVKIIIFDVDGVLTDGRIYVNDQGIETKSFYVLDGYGIKLLQKMKIEIAVISGRDTPGVALRMQYLGIHHVFQGVSDKLKIYQNLLKNLGLQDKEAAYMGDDLPDISVLKRAGLALTVPNAVKEVLACTPFVTQSRGGEGAVREVCEFILKAQGKWEEMLK
jgi:3-deoxy-D-manno-octulosonate 8-phosphate phosphatase (KDO 8-P phosphatase)